MDRQRSGCRRFLESKNFCHGYLPHEMRGKNWNRGYPRRAAGVDKQLRRWHL
jgi:hypothetical protein